MLPGSPVGGRDEPAMALASSTSASCRKIIFVSASMKVNFAPAAPTALDE
ncbi:hypothetical protein OHA77_08515 [Streptosporangium sp. NBC_01639]|nr:hypothetical protein OHA77_08515 [Streptosporangium sp. NBC_01639]